MSADLSDAIRGGVWMRIQHVGSEVGNRDEDTDTEIEINIEPHLFEDATKSIGYSG